MLIAYRVSLATVLLALVATACSSTTGTTDGGASDGGTAVADAAAADAALPPDAAPPPDAAVPVDGSLPPVDSGADICGGCVKGALSAGNDSIKLTGVTGIDDGKSDAVVVTGTYHLESAATAILTSTCEGQSSGERKTVTEADAAYSLKVDFQVCTTDIVKVTLFPVGGSSGTNYVKCCFRKGRDF